MKKLLSLLLICAVITFNTACSKTEQPKDNTTGSNQSENIVEQETDVSKDETGEGVEGESQTDEKENLELKPEAKPETKPVTKPAPKPVVKPAPKPETKPQPEKKPENDILKGELKNIIEKIYAASGLELAKTEFKEVTSSNAEYLIGSADIEFSEALASEPLINVVPHSLVLLRAKDNSDIDKIKAEIKSKANPRKWICVGVEEDDVVVDNIDNLIVLIMDNESEKLHEAFLSLAK